MMSGTQEVACVSAMVVVGSPTWSRLPCLHSGQMLFTKPITQLVVEMGVTPIPPPTPANMHNQREYIFLD
jgi:hypothetical protein